MGAEAGSGQPTEGSVPPSRRTFLQLAAAAGFLGTAGVGCRTRLLTQGEPSSVAAAPPVFLARGLAAMTRGHTNWVAAHYGAAVIAAHYFPLDNALDERAARAVRANVDAYMQRTPQEFPEPDPGAGKADPEKIVATLAPHVHEYRSGGHGAIYASLALRALRDLPEFATPAVVDGICRLIDLHVGAYRPVRPSPYQVEHPLCPYEDAADLAASALRAALRPWNHVREVGASGVLHWLTHAEALVTLEGLGYRDVARRGHEAFQMQINRPVEYDGQSAPVRPPVDLRGAAYWESETPRLALGGSWLGGHSFKLPYSLFRLLDLVDDPDLAAQSLARGALLPVPFL